MFLSSEKIINLLWTKFPYVKKVGGALSFVLDCPLLKSSVELSSVTLMN